MKQFKALIDLLFERKVFAKIWGKAGKKFPKNAIPGGNVITAYLTSLSSLRPSAPKDLLKDFRHLFPCLGLKLGPKKEAAHK